ncbi:hypothetical protein [Pseudoalteromonas sp. TB64]|uniref:hypothetical protein n=1 Tax=Pseudoalteromonas sp. TB64 TaxID=1938600 RepID=UPI000463DFC3|nr:hypothetical protein [Pseudoalteromonas sp. TB64]
MKASNHKIDKRLLKVIASLFVVASILMAIMGDMSLLGCVIIYFGISISQRFGFKYFQGSKRTLFIIIGCIVSISFGGLLAWG